jgi:hypothetical protein
MWRWEVDDIVMVAVQREECECINEHELLTPKCLEGCKKKNRPEGTKRNRYTHARIGLGMMLCVLL